MAKERRKVIFCTLHHVSASASEIDTSNAVRVSLETVLLALSVRCGAIKVMERSGVGVRARRVAAQVVPAIPPPIITACMEGDASGWGLIRCGDE